MANRSEALIIESLGNRFDSVYSTAAGGVTASLSVSAAGNEKIHLDSLGWSIRNVSGAAYTATLSVKDASTGGAVRASWGMIVANAAGQLDNFSINITGVKGTGLWVDFGTPQASVIQSLSIAGWKETMF